MTALDWIMIASLAVLCIVFIAAERRDAELDRQRERDRRNLGRSK